MPTDRQRVLFLAPDLLGAQGGIARFSRVAVRALAESGVPVHVVVLHDRAGSVWDGPGDVMYEPCGGSRLRFIVRSLLAATRRARYVLVGLVNFAPLAWVASVLARAELVTVLHGIEVWGPLRPHRRFALRRSGRWIAVSRYTARQSSTLNDLPLEDIDILYHCVDPALSHAVSPPESRDRSVLFVGRVDVPSRYKGLELLIRALPDLAVRFPDVVLRVVGEGDDQDRLAELSQTLGVADRIEWLGTVDERELSSLYGRAQVFAMPSSGEGFGFVFAEAMAHGTPVVGGTADASPEVIEDGVTGLLVDPGSLEQVREALLTLLGDPQLCRRMGEAGAIRVREQFGYERFRETLLSYLPGLRRNRETEGPPAQARLPR